MSWSCQHCIAHRAERSGGPGFLPSSPGALPLLVLAAAAPLPFLLKLPGDSTPAAPGQVSGSWGESFASAIHPSMLLPPPQPPDLPEALSAPAPPVNQAWAPADHPACPGDGPLPCVWAH